ncbi:hypothetical protein [Pyrodictium abyssi]|uniref:Uncharacterized protein n=1 Tax=Pyrodictium abyssi TaxID=54256 RepID=A0ABN6ZR58_9CREN|nr:hypothetical protein PABY_22620 [Pyrodictium abyssi]
MLLAAVVSRGAVDALLDALRGLSGGPVTLLAYRERGRTGDWSLRYYEAAQPREAVDAATWLAGGTLGVYALCSGVCSFFAGFMPSGAPARIMACSLRRLGRQALVTGSPPAPARGDARAVLYSYAARLLRDGAGPERLAAKIAERAGGGAGLVLALVSRGRAPAPVAALAVSGRLRLCVMYSGGSAVAAAAPTREPLGWSCMERSVVSVYPAGGVARVETRDLDRVLYG